MDIAIPATTKGHYIWNDNENCLEFISEVSSDARDKKKQFRKTAVGPRTLTRSRDEVSTFTLPFAKSLVAGLPSVRGGANTIGPPRGSPKFGMSDERNEIVTLNNVKEVALDRLMEELDIRSQTVSTSFRTFAESQKSQQESESVRAMKRNSAANEVVADKGQKYRARNNYFIRQLKNTREFDDFLLALLHYFTCFFDQLEQELKPQKSSFLQPSKAEMKALADTRKKMEVTRRKLAQSYCVLILGLGIQDQHHMGCGKKRVSNTHRDKKMYEDLYLYCTYVVWITFRRKELERVKIEVGNMLRSEVFNPALKHKIKSSITAEAKKESVKKAQNEKLKSAVVPDQKKSGPKTPAQKAHELLIVELPKLEVLTPAQHRRMKGKGTAIGTSINQRSTVLVSLLPLPKEESNYLFQSLVGNQKRGIMKEKTIADFSPDYIGQKIGIIGELKEYFNMSDLTPKNMENDEDEESNDDANARDGNRSDGEQKLSRQGDAISRVTTAEATR